MEHPKILLYQLLEQIILHLAKKNENDAGSCYATAAYYPPIATTEAYFAQNGEIIVWESQKLIYLLVA